MRSLRLRLSQDQETIARLSLDARRGDRRGFAVCRRVVVLGFRLRILSFHPLSPHSRFILVFVYRKTYRRLPLAGHHSLDARKEEINEEIKDRVVRVSYLISLPPSDVSLFRLSQDCKTHSPRSFSTPLHPQRRRAAVYL